MNNGSSDLRNAIIRKEIPENENPNKIDIIENILNNALKITNSTCTGKAGHASSNFLNEICQIIYSLYWEKEVIKKVYSYIMNSIKL